MKNVLKVLLLIIISAFIVTVLVEVSSTSLAAVNDSLTLITPDNFTGDKDDIKYRYRETTKGDLIPAEGELYFDAMVGNAAYLCAWHYQHFFYWMPIQIDMEIEHFRSKKN